MLLKCEAANEVQKFARPADAKLVNYRDATPAHLTKSVDASPGLASPH